MINLILCLPVLSGVTLRVCNSTASPARERVWAEGVGSNQPEACPGGDPSQVDNLSLN